MDHPAARSLLQRKLWDDDADGWIVPHLSGISSPSRHLSTSVAATTSGEGEAVVKGRRGRERNRGSRQSQGSSPSESTVGMHQLSLLLKWRNLMSLSFLVLWNQGHREGGTRGHTPKIHTKIFCGYESFEIFSFGSDLSTSKFCPLPKKSWLRPCLKHGRRRSQKA